MIDITAIPTVLTSLKVASDLAQAAVTLRDAQAVQLKVLELNRSIIEAQSAAIAAQAEHAALVGQIRELEARIGQLEDWAAEKQRYELKDYGGGTFAYAPKPGMEGGEPPHRLCEKCYQQGKKGLLHFLVRKSGREKVKCYTCGSEYLLGLPESPEPSPLRRSSWIDRDGW